MPFSRRGRKRLTGALGLHYHAFYWHIHLVQGFTSGCSGTAQMAAGDGLADIVGRRYGKMKWSFAPSKSVAGTVGFIVVATIVTTMLLLLYGATGSLPQYSLETLLPRVALISVLCSAVELAPFWEDNERALCRSRPGINSIVTTRQCDK